MADLAPYLALVLLGFLPNEVWRVLGLVAARGVREESEILVFVRAVATAVLAGVVAVLVITPPGALAQVAAPVRFAAIAAGYLGYLLAGRSVFVGVALGESALLVGAWWSAS